MSDATEQSGEWGGDVPARDPFGCTPSRRFAEVAE
jgi:hypothetical protein